jgi:hypothetical protein
MLSGKILLILVLGSMATIALANTNMTMPANVTKEFYYADGPMFRGQIFEKITDNDTGKVIYDGPRKDPVPAGVTPVPPPPHTCPNGTVMHPTLDWYSCDPITHDLVHPKPINLSLTISYPANVEINNIYTISFKVSNTDTRVSNGTKIEMVGLPVIEAKSNFNLQNDTLIIGTLQPNVIKLSTNSLFILMIPQFLGRSTFSSLKLPSWTLGT